ncbi:MAG: sialidase, partial [Isosphaeraceae bacterium]
MTRLGLSTMAALLGFAWADAGTTRAEDTGPPPSIARYFEPPPEFQGDLGAYRSPLVFADGR